MFLDITMASRIAELENEANEASHAQSGNYDGSLREEINQKWKGRRGRRRIIENDAAREMRSMGDVRKYVGERGVENGE